LVIAQLSELINIPVRDQRVDAVAVGREAPQHDLLSILDLLCIAVTPLTSLSASAYTNTLNVQLPSSIGRKVTEAVIWRKSDWISCWISVSVFSAAGAASGVAASAPSSVVVFSWPSEEDFFFDLLSSLKTLT
jgi:uncharacterized membrane protein YbhN (UPF0104 family)